jgi:hypothetical protein
MMEKMLWVDYFKSKKNLLLKMGIPFALVLAAYQFNLGNFTLVMVLIFTIVMGAGLKIVQLKTMGVYNRLITAPISKRRLFLEISSMSIALYFLQFLPTLLIGVYYTGIVILVFSLLAIAVVVLIGMLVGVHAKSFGQIHLNSLVTVLPLAAVAMVPLSVSYLFPFIYISQAIFSLTGILWSGVVIVGLYGVLLADVSRL